VGIENDKLARLWREGGPLTLDYLNCTLTLRIR
jgi:hypothetical protein